MLEIIFCSRQRQRAGTNSIFSRRSKDYISKSILKKKDARLEVSDTLNKLDLEKMAQPSAVNVTPSVGDAVCSQILKQIH